MGYVIEARTHIHTIRYDAERCVMLVVTVHISTYIKVERNMHIGRR